MIQAGNGMLRRVLAGILMVIGLAACAPDLPQATLTADFTRSLTPALPDVNTPRPLTIHERPTLPPTWTPTFTPSATQTPTITPTPSITPSPTPISQADLCAAFEVTTALDGLLYRAGDPVIFNIQMPLADVTIDFSAHHATTDAMIAGRLAGSTFYRLVFDPVELPAAGRYDWTLTVSAGSLTEQCELTGFFVIDNTLPEATAEKTSEATAEVTSEATAEITSEATAEVTSEATVEATATSTQANSARRTPTLTPTRRP
jgi:hypothetical protein